MTNNYEGKIKTMQQEIYELNQKLAETLKEKEENTRVFKLEISNLKIEFNDSIKKIENENYNIKQESERTKLLLDRNVKE